MSELTDPRPVFTIIMGCNGCGKSMWKRESWDLLPDRYYDQDSVAAGVGGWEKEVAREEARRIVESKIDESLLERLSFGIESTYSGRPGRALVERAKAADFRIEGVYIGTEDPEINVARIRQRVEDLTGHWVDPERVSERWKFSLANLRRTAELFDDLELFDNSRHDVLYRTRLASQCLLERGEVVQQAGELACWSSQWLEGYRSRRESLRILAAKRERRRLHEERAKRRRERILGQVPGR